jgi:hypothetical protein
LVPVHTGTPNRFLVGKLAKGIDTRGTSGGGTRHFHSNRCTILKRSDAPLRGQMNYRSTAARETAIRKKMQRGSLISIVNSNIIFSRPSSMDHIEAISRSAFANGW